MTKDGRKKTEDFRPLSLQAGVHSGSRGWTSMWVFPFVHACMGQLLSIAIYSSGTRHGETEIGGEKQLWQVLYGPAT